MHLTHTVKKIKLHEQIGVIRTGGVILCFPYLFNVTHGPGCTGHTGKPFLSRGHEKIDVLFLDVYGDKSISGNGVNHKNGTVVMGHLTDFLYGIEHTGAGFMMNRCHNGNILVFFQRFFDHSKIRQFGGRKLQIHTRDLVIPGNLHHPGRIGPVVHHTKLLAFGHQ